MKAELFRGTDKKWKIGRKGWKLDQMLPAKCVECGAKAEFLCDHVVGKTIGGGQILCNARLCAFHKRDSNVEEAFTGAKQHVCPKHF